MKRDLDLIREILLYVEKNCDGQNAPNFRESDLYKSNGVNVIFEHVTLAIERGLLEADHYSNGWHLKRLTWDGHDFLANASVPEVWGTAKKIAGGLAFGVFCNVLAKVATDYGLGLLGKLQEAMDSLGF